MKLEDHPFQQDVLKLWGDICAQCGKRCDQHPKRDVTYIYFRAYPNDTSPTTQDWK